MFFALRVIWRLIPFMMTATLLVVWIVVGRGLVGLVINEPKSRAAQDLDYLERVAARENPKYAEELAALRAVYPERPLAAVLIAETGTESDRNLSVLSQERRQQLQRQVVLASQAEGLANRAEREEFLLAHGVFIESLGSQGDATFVSNYLKDLDGLVDDPQARRHVLDDPTAALIWMNVSDPSLREYYVANKTWLQPLLGELVLIQDAATETTTDPESDVEADPAKGSDLSPLAVALATAKRFDPYLRRAVTEHDLGSAGLQLFLDEKQGEVIAAVAKELPSPELLSVLEVVYANSDWVQEHLARQTPQQVASSLLKIKTSQPLTWEVATSVPMALRLGEDAPRDAQDVLERYGYAQITVLLYGSYSEQIEPATRAVAQFGDLAIYILAKYSDDPRIGKLLANPEIGPRLIPYLLRYGDQGLDRIEENKAWLDKTFDPDGRPKVAEWWQAVPIVGAPINVVRNWSQGLPNEWSELGWAALDAADAVLLVATFGGTVVAKQAATTAGKTAARRSLVGMAKQSAKRLTIPMRKPVARAASLLRSAARQSARATAAIPGFRSLVRASSSLGRYTSKVKSISASTSRIIVRHRRLIAGSLAAVGLAVTIRYRSLPMASDSLDELGHYLQAEVLESIAGSMHSVAEAISQVSGASVASLGDFIYYVLAVLLALATTITALRTLSPRGVRYV